MQRQQAKAGHQDARQARVGTGPTTHDVLGGPQMSAISHQTLDVNKDPSFVSPLCTSLCSLRPSPAQQPYAKRIAPGGPSSVPQLAGEAAVVPLHSKVHPVTRPSTHLHFGVVVMPL
ncbi:hypothetical protein QJQ45_017055, partial [Haematococcus lacustris]